MNKITLERAYKTKTAKQIAREYKLHVKKVYSL